MKIFLQQQIKLIPFFVKDVKNGFDPILGKISKEFYLSENEFIVLFYDYKYRKLISPVEISSKNFNLNKIKYLSTTENSLEPSIQDAEELGLQLYFPNSYFVSKKMSVEKDSLLIMIGIKKNIFKCFSGDLLKNRLYIDSIIILVLLILCIFVTIFAIAPIFFFIRKLNTSSLNSEIFKLSKGFEFNHIRWLRLNLRKFLRKIETYEAGRLQILNTFINHQNDIETGKMVSQIIHDLKSPLSVFEELLHEKCFIKKGEIYKRSNLALMKIYSLIESIRDPKREKILNKQKGIFDFSKLLYEMSWYAKSRNSQVTVIPDFKTPEIYCDHNKLERCLQNLIRNAVYFCNSYCTVDWKVQNNRDLYIEIIDDGKGVFSEIKDKIFEWRVTDNKIEGTGVGLSYVKFVTDIHGGTISYFRRNNLTVFALLIPNIFYKYSDDFILLQKNIKKSAIIKNNDIKNKVIFLIEDNLFYEKIKLICWPSDIKIVYHTNSDDVFDLFQCFCIYTDTSSDIIEKALSLGISVVLHKHSYSKQLILKKVLQTRKKAVYTE